MLKRKILFYGITLFLFISLFIPDLNADPGKDGDLFPAINAYKTGYLNVSDTHQIFYQLGGNSKGKPVMVIHGGPGAGCFPSYFRFFNPEKYHIILHDQRGCGKSKPYGELKDNSTQHLVEDIEKLRKHLNLDKVVLFGGSWGSTLILAYAETYPDNVRAMILRGIFTATKAEIDHFYHGGTALYFPENYRKLIEDLPYPEKKTIPAQMLEKIQSKDPDVRNKFARRWAAYELKIAYLEIPNQRIDGFFKNWNPLAFSLLENYYMANNCFLEEKQLINNTDKIAHIPAIIINGRYDLICPPTTAYKLHKKLPKSKLVIVEGAGHSGSEAGTQHQLVKAAAQFE